MGQSPHLNRLPLIVKLGLLLNLGLHILDNRTLHHMKLNMIAKLLRNLFKREPLGLEKSLASPERFAKWEQAYLREVEIEDEDRNKSDTEEHKVVLPRDSSKRSWCGHEENERRHEESTCRERAALGTEVGRPDLGGIDVGGRIQA